MINKNKIGAVNANSTAATPRRCDASARVVRFLKVI